MSIVSIPQTVTSTSGGGASSSNSASLTSSILSSADFLKILLAEFQNQDPTQPTDPTRFASQLVQFANLGQLQQINGAVQQSPETSLMQAASAYIGRQVVAPGSMVGVQNGKATSIVYAPSAPGSYTALVSNASGKLMDSVSLGSLPGGTLQTFSWQPPSSVSDGLYQVQIVNGKNIPMSGLLEQGTVNSVSMSSSGVALDLGNLVIPQSNVTSVQQ